MDRWPTGILKCLDGSGYDHASATVEAKVESKIRSSLTLGLLFILTKCQNVLFIHWNVII